MLDGLLCHLPCRFVIGKSREFLKTYRDLFINKAFKLIAGLRFYLSWNSLTNFIMNRMWSLQKGTKGEEMVGRYSIYGKCACG